METQARSWRLIRVIIVRFADDFTVGFEFREDAERFLADLRDRFHTFHLELHPDKTRLIEFGRYAARDRKRRGEGKPESFDFLGFTHTCDRTRNGRFIVLAADHAEAHASATARDRSRASVSPA